MITTVDTGYPPELAALTDAPPDAFRIVRYGAGADQFGELWPALGRTGRAPVVMLLHGGYWRDRYRLDIMHAFAADLSRRGYAVWNVEYRRVGSPGGGWPGTFHDVAAAFDALADLADTDALDLTRVTAVGHSAGGQLALWASGRHRDDAPGGPLGPWGPRRVVPTLAVALAGVCDLRLAAELGCSDGAVAGLLGGGPDEIPAVYDLACPTRLLPLGLRQIVVHGSVDLDVPIELSRRYARLAGEECELLILPGVDHLAMIDPAGEAWPSLVEVLAPPVP
jgi:acetyl esterase/lipase